MSLYDIAAHGAMVGDAHRFAAYREALRQAIVPGCTVLDIGTGTGIHALLACRFGAARVHAVEPDDIIQVAREAARDNGVADRIVFHQQSSTGLTLTEPVDVVVSDLRGVLPLFQHHIPAIVDARRRLLRPGGALIPRRDVIRAAPVQDEAVYAGIASVWDGNGDGLDLSAARAMATERVYRRRVAADHLLAAPRPWVTLDYATIESPDAAGRLDFILQRDGVLHGFALWFDGTLADGIELSNAPGGDELIYGMSFLPVPRAVPVIAGEALSLSLAARLVGDEYVWQWVTVVGGAGGRERFSQSSFYGTPLTPRTLAVAAAQHVPVLTSEGRIDHATLTMMDGETPLVEIARRLRERFPEAFDSERAALDRTAALARRYAE